MAAALLVPVLVSSVAVALPLLTPATLLLNAFIKSVNGLTGVPGVKVLFHQLFVILP
ncbi:MAG: hypothetical protein HC867_09425 [Bacteroidia bacterium]|nr:hypothetical protein [Bacteroidia bacterium]